MCDDLRAVEQEAYNRDRETCARDGIRAGKILVCIMVVMAVVGWVFWYFNPRRGFTTPPAAAGPLFRYY